MTRLGLVARKPWFGLWRLLRRSLFEGHEYNVYVPFGWRTLTPWFSTERPYWPREDARLRADATVSPDRAYFIYEFARYSLLLAGNLAECGVFRGATAGMLCRAILEGPKKKSLHLFDTFSGIPEDSLNARDHHSAGDFANTSFEYVQSRLQLYHFVEFYPGAIPEIFATVSGEHTYCFVHVDLVNYRAVLECCRWFWPKLGSGGIMLIDDYGFYPYRQSVRAAVDEFFGPLAVRPIVLHSGQAVVIKPQ